MNLNNQQGYASIFIATMVLILVVTFMGAAGTYFSNLYNQVARQQRNLAAHIASEDFARMAQRARETWIKNGGGCGGVANVLSEPARQMCWPNQPGGSVPGPCVIHPLGSANPANPRLICLSGGGFNSPAGAAQMQLLTLKVVDPPMKFHEKVRSEFYVFKQNLERTLDLFAERVQNSAVAQTASEVSYLPSLAGAPRMRFLAGGQLNCNPAAAPRDYCKICPADGGPTTGGLETCVRFQICLKTTACGANDWVRRTVGFIAR